MENTVKKTDHRIIKTKRAIYRAMTQLIAEKDITEISVKEISELADINRKTFYNYYSSIYQLEEELENEIVAYFADLIKSIDFYQALANPAIVFDKLHETILQHAEFADVLFSSKSNYSLVNKVLNKLIEMTSDAAVENFSSNPVKTEYITRFIFAGEISAYQAWYNSDRKVPLREISQTIEALCTKGLDELIAESKK